MKLVEVIQNLSMVVCLCDPMFRNGMVSSPNTDAIPPRVEVKLAVPDIFEVRNSLESAQLPVYTCLKILGNKKGIRCWNFWRPFFMTFNLYSRSPLYNISFRPVLYESAIVDNLGAGVLSSKNKYKSQRKDIPCSHTEL